MKEIIEMHKIFNCEKDYSNSDLGPYGKLYHHTNENLRAYIPNMDGKRVLTISSSGDHLLNIIVNGTFNVDTFDINMFSPLFQSLKLTSIRNLSCKDSYDYLNSLSSDLYFKFNGLLPNKERKLFNFVYKHDIDEIAYKLFYLQKINNFINNNYFDLEVLKFLKKNLKYLDSNHFYTNVYGLPNYIDGKYDYIFLSNISQYVKNVDDYLHLIMSLRLHLNDNGGIYYAYLYEKEPDDVIEGIRSINSNFDEKFDCGSYRDIIDNTDIFSFNSAEYPDINKDSVLILRK